MLMLANARVHPIVLWFLDSKYVDSSSHVITYSYLVEVDLNNLLDTHLTSTMCPVMHFHTLKIAESSRIKAPFVSRSTAYKELPSYDISCYHIVPGQVNSYRLSEFRR